LPILQEALGYVAGYGIRMFMLAQDITQIEEIYGDKQAVDSGAATRIAYAPNKIETAEKLARMTGKTTITEEKASHSKDVIGIKGGSISLSTDKIGRDLMMADEFMSLNYFDMVVFVAGQPPIYGRKAFYYENPVMLARAKIKPPERSATLRNPVVPVTIDSQAVTEDVPASARQVIASKWEKSRKALNDQIPFMSEEFMKNVATDKPVAKQVSRYADSARTLSAEEWAQVKMLTEHAALRQHVAITPLSAF
jgi:type IV secretion system protein VirD4